MMNKLTKEQIQFIDESLKKGGIKYWDLRIEMVDHLVTDMEHNAISNDFDSELVLALKRANWHFNLKEVNTQGWKNTNKQYRRKYFKEIEKFITSIKGIALLLLFVCAHYYLSTIISHNSFMTLSFVLFILPMIYYLYLGISIWMKKYGRSVHLEYGLNYMLFSFLMLQVIPQLSAFKNANEDIQKLVWFILLPFYLITIYSGYKGFQSALKRVNQMKKMLD